MTTLQTLASVQAKQEAMVQRMNTEQRALFADLCTFIKEINTAMPDVDRNLDDWQLGIIAVFTKAFAAEITSTEKGRFLASPQRIEEAFVMLIDHIEDYFDGDQEALNFSGIVPALRAPFITFLADGGVSEFDIECFFTHWDQPERSIEEIIEEKVIELADALAFAKRA